MTALAVGAGLALLAALYVALPLLRGAPAPVAPDDAESLVRRYRRGAARVCARCGPRPEADAVYCSSCGVRLG